MHVIRVVTQNIWAFHGDWPARREVLRDGLATLGSDVLGVQEAVLTDDYDQTRDLLGAGYEVAHQERRDSGGSGVSIASRWPIAAVRELDSDTIAAEIDEGEGAGRVRGPWRV